MQLLKTGQNRFATVSGDMTDVIHHSTQHFSDDDLTAIATYLKSLPAGKDDLAPAPAPANAPVHRPPNCSPPAAAWAICSSAPIATAGRRRRKSCSRLWPEPEDCRQDPTTLLHITLTGWKTAETAAHPRVYTMPAFSRLADQEIAEILSFVRTSWGNARAGHRGQSEEDACPTRP